MIRYLMSFWLGVFIGLFGWSADALAARERLPLDIHVLLDNSKSIVDKQQGGEPGGTSDSKGLNTKVVEMVEELLGPMEGDGGGLLEERDRVHVHVFGEGKELKLAGISNSGQANDDWLSRLRWYEEQETGDVLTDFRSVVARLSRLGSEPQRERRVQVVIIASDFIHDGEQDACRLGVTDGQRRQREIAKEVASLPREVRYAVGDTVITLPLFVGLLYVHNPGDSPYSSGSEEELRHLQSCFQRLLNERELLQAFEKRFDTKAVDFVDAQEGIPGLIDEIEGKLEQRLDRTPEIQGAGEVMRDPLGQPMVSVVVRNSSLVDDWIREIRFYRDADGSEIVANASLDGEESRLAGGSRRRLEVVIPEGARRVLLSGGRFALRVVGEGGVSKGEPALVESPSVRPLTTMDPVWDEEGTSEGRRLRLVVSNPNLWPVEITEVRVYPSAETGEYVQLDDGVAVAAGSFQEIRPLIPDHALRLAVKTGHLEVEAMAEGVPGEKVAAVLPRQPAPGILLRPWGREGEFYRVRVELEPAAGGLPDLLEEITLIDRHRRPVVAEVEGVPLAFEPGRRVEPLIAKLDQAAARKLFSAEGFTAKLRFRLAGMAEVNASLPEPTPLVLISDSARWVAGAAGRLAFRVRNEGHYQRPIGSFEVGERKLEPRQAGDPSELLPGEEREVLVDIPESTWLELMLSPTFRIWSEDGNSEERNALTVVSPPRTGLKVTDAGFVTSEDQRQLTLQLKVANPDRMPNRITGVIVADPEGGEPLRQAVDEAPLAGGAERALALTMDPAWLDRPFWRRAAVKVALLGWDGKETSSFQAQTPAPLPPIVVNEFYEGGSVPRLDAQKRTLTVRVENPNPRLTLQVKRLAFYGSREGSELLKEITPDEALAPGAVSSLPEVTFGEKEWERIWGAGGVWVEAVTERVADVSARLGARRQKLVVGNPYALEISAIRVESKRGGGDSEALVLRIDLVDRNNTRSPPLEDVEVELGGKKLPQSNALRFVAGKPLQLEVPLSMDRNTPANELLDKELKISIPRVRAKDIKPLKNSIDVPFWFTRFCILLLFTLVSLLVVMFRRLSNPSQGREGGLGWYLLALSGALLPPIVICLSGFTDWRIGDGVNKVVWPFAWILPSVSWFLALGIHFQGFSATRLARGERRRIEVLVAEQVCRQVGWMFAVLIVAGFLIYKPIGHLSSPTIADLIQDPAPFVQGTRP